MIRTILIFVLLLGTRLGAGEIDELATKCDNGDMKACGILGFEYTIGKKVQKDPPKGVKYMLKACEGGEFNSCYNMANITKSFYDTICQGPKNEQCQQMAEAQIKLFTKACDGGIMDACRELSLIYVNGEITKQDINKATTHLIQACENKHAPSCYDLANLTKIALKDALSVDACKGEMQKKCQQLADSIIIFYKKSCDGGYAIGCAALAELYVKGEGVKQDYFTAKEYYKKSCDGGFALGCGALGAMYESGLGVRQDYTKSIELFEKACDGGVAVACNSVGKFYTDGTGVKQDYSKAMEYYGKACDLKNDDGCKNYATINQHKK